MAPTHLSAAPPRSSLDFQRRLIGSDIAQNLQGVHLPAHSLHILSIRGMSYDRKCVGVCVWVTGLGACLVMIFSVPQHRCLRSRENEPASIRWEKEILHRNPSSLWHGRRNLPLKGDSGVMCFPSLVSHVIHGANQDRGWPSSLSSAGSLVLTRARQDKAQSRQPRLSLSIVYGGKSAHASLNHHGASWKPSDQQSSFLQLCSWIEGASQEPYMEKKTMTPPLLNNDVFS